MATRKGPRAWTSKALADYSKASASGYLPGVQDVDAPCQDEWTTQRHLQAARMRSQVFIPGF